MKNIQPVLFFFETINQWNYHTYVDLFDMKPSKRYEGMFHEVLYGISHPLSKYEMYITTTKYNQGIGFMLEDRKTQKPVLFAGLQEYGHTAVMWPDWMYIPMNATKLVFDERDERVEQLEVYAMSEEEHFQTMMLRDLPPHSAIEKGMKIFEYLSPIAKKHSIGFSIDYENMDHDFKNFIPSENAFNTIESLFGNALELYYEAEEHGNPFSHYTIS